MRGRLIAFEGVDGSGKSTQASLLARSIGASRCVLTSEPGATPLGERLRALLLDPNSPQIVPRAEALLLLADRAEHVAEIVEPALARGLWVISDRNAASTLAYQGYGRGLDLDELRSLVSFSTGGTTTDLNVLIDVPLEMARERLASARPDRLESLSAEFHSSVASGYRELARSDPAHWAEVDGEGSPGEVAVRVLEAIQKRLGPVPGAGA